MARHHILWPVPATPGTTTVPSRVQVHLPGTSVQQVDRYTNTRILSPVAEVYYDRHRHETATVTRYR